MFHSTLLWLVILDNVCSLAIVSLFISLSLFLFLSVIHLIYSIKSIYFED